MKPNTIYLVSSLALLAAFALYFVPANARLEATLTAEREAAAARDAAAKAARTEREAQAAAEAEQRRQERERAAAERRARREADEQARDNALAIALASAQEERRRLRDSVAELETQWSALTRRREALDASLFRAQRETEMLKIERRSLDLELQRSAAVLTEEVIPGVLWREPVFPPHYVDSM